MLIIGDNKTTLAGRIAPDSQGKRYKQMPNSQVTALFGFLPAKIVALCVIKYAPAKVCQAKPLFLYLIGYRVRRL